ncbi:hypothetical protein FOBRF1_012529 [Fusarium oxysporum]
MDRLVLELKKSAPYCGCDLPRANDSKSHDAIRVNEAHLDFATQGSTRTTSKIPSKNRVPKEGYHDDWHLCASLKLELGQAIQDVQSKHANATAVIQPIQQSISQKERHKARERMLLWLASLDAIPRQHLASTNLLLSHYKSTTASIIANKQPLPLLASRHR